MSLVLPPTPTPVVGPLMIDSDFRASKLKEILELETFHRDQLAPLFQKIVKYNRLYHSDRDDPRKPHEKWRANTFVPYPYSGTETKVAALSDILLSSDPPVQAEGVGSEDEELARKIEALHAYTLVKNKWGGNLDQSLRGMVIDGTHVWKVVWVKRQRRVVYHPEPEEIAAFEEALQTAQQATGVQAPQDPKQFEEWRRTVNLANVKGEYPTIPELPVPGPRVICEYEGPEFQRVDLFELRLDPMVEDWQKQHQIIQRVVRPWKWVEKRTGPGKLFDPIEVEKAHATGGADGGTFNEWQEQIAAMLGITASAADPTYRDSAEILEVFRPDDEEAPYSLVLNRRAIANNNIGQYPFGHGMYPYVPIRNVPIRKRALGMSDFQPSYRLYHEMNNLRDHRIDSIVLGVLPMYEKLQGVGIPDLQKKLQPGGIIEVSKAGALKRMTNWDPGLQWAFQEINSLKEDIDESNSTPSHVRGGTVALNRVSATEAERRFSQAIIRVKQSVLRIEEDCGDLLRQSMFLHYQFGSHVTRRRIGGDDNTSDPFKSYTRADFLRALDYDFKFRGATRTLNRDLSAQQLQSFIQLASTLQVLGPPVLLKLLRKLYEGLGHKGAKDLITDADIEAATQQQQAALQQQDAANEQGADVAKAADMEATTPPPDEVELQG